MIFNSIKWRLQAWHGFLLLLLVGGLMTGFYFYEKKARLAAIDSQLREAMTPLLPRFAPPMNRRGGGRPMFERQDPGPGGPPPGEDRFPQHLTQGVYHIAWNADNVVMGRSEDAPETVPAPDYTERENGTKLRTRGEFRELAHRVPDNATVLVGISLKPTMAELRRLAFALVGIGASIIIVGWSVGWWTASRALRPIDDISRAAQEIAAGDLARRINTSETQSELGRLATVLNSTFERLDSAFTRQKQFTSDAAHELRTPVSVILTQTQSTLNRERSAGEYRDTLESCQRAAQRMRRLIESLLELARLDAGAETMKHERTDLSRLAADCVHLVLPLAQEKKIVLNSDCFPVHCTGDAEKLSLVVTNLLTNAIHHNREGGEARIQTRREGDEAVLIVSDNGPGIPEEHLPHIFDRFYRVDAARTSSNGRSGLGLAITRAIVESHGGSIRATSKPGEGCAFEVHLPLARG